MDCGFKAAAATEAEVMAKIAEHAKSVHKIDKISPELMNKVKNAIKNKLFFKYSHG